MAQTTKRKKKKKQRRKQLGAVPVLLALLAALLLLLMLFRLFLNRAPSVPEPSAVTEAVTPEPLETLPPSALTAECFGQENGYKTYVSDTVTAALGIDVSSHQGWIDWQAVADSGVDYAILRAGFRGYTDGETSTDAYFSYNLESAAACGLDLGLYYFSQALTEEEAVAEAQQVLDLISGFTLQYPIYFDWEPVSDSAARTASISGTELTACAKAFCSTIEAAGYEAGIYFNLSQAAGLYHLHELKDYDFWLAEYSDTPSFPYAVGMWQYTSEGTVSGISTAVDLNLSFRGKG